MDSHVTITRARRRPAVTRAVVALIFAVMLSAGSAEAQYSSGSSGKHGAFPPVPDTGTIPQVSYIVWNVRTGGVRYCSTYTLVNKADQCDASSTTNVFVQIPNIPAGGLTTGIYEFTSVDLPSLAPLFLNRYIVLVGASPNVPVSILSQGDITMPGSAAGYATELHLEGSNGVSASANFSVAGGKGAPGGFDGGASGNGGTSAGNGSSGFGPSGGAGGQANGTLAAANGTSASASPLNPSLVPLTGGSGGGGAAGVPSNAQGCVQSELGFAGGSGGGGGGALLLAASGRITLGSYVSIIANGGAGGYGPNSGCGLYAGGGSGGSVRIVAQELVGTGAISVNGGGRQNGTNGAPGGFVRIEAALNTFSGQINGASGGSFLSFPTAAVPTNLPTLRITSIAGTAAPSNPGALLTAPDITFASGITTPVTLSLSASNIPIGTQVNLKIVPATGDATTAASNGLSGTVASSTAQATVTIPPGAGIVTASATFTTGGSGGSALNTVPMIDGERPKTVEVIASADGTSRTYLIARSGARFEIGQVSR